MYAERLGPYLVGLATLCAALIWHAKVAEAVASTGIESRSAVAATFDVMVTLTAFLFAVYVLALAPGGGFLERIFETQTFRIFKRYVAEALVLGCASALASVPFTSTPPERGVWNGFVFQALWLALAVTAFLAFLRVAHIFLAWMGMQSKRRSGKRAG